MTTAQFRKLASPTALALAEAYERTRAGETHGFFPCTAPRCAGRIEYTGKILKPHVTAGSCNTSRCVRWAIQE